MSGTTSRFGITTWESGSDAFTRQQMNDSHVLIDEKAAGFIQGDGAPTVSASAYSGFFYYSSTTSSSGSLFYSNGVDWFAIAEPASDVADIGSVEVVGSSLQYARADHVHILGANSVNENSIVNSAVTVNKIGTGAVTSDKIGANQVIAGKIAANAVNTDQIVDGAVTTAKIGALQVIGDKIAIGAVTEGKIGSAAVTESKIGPGAVTASKLGVLGAGSGVDADLLDGQHGSYYQPVSTAVTTSTSFGGDVTGTYNNLQVANDSHTHDTRYYTESEADSRFVNVTGDTITGTLTMSSGAGNDQINFSASTTNDSRGISFNNRTALSANSSDGWLRLNQNSEFGNGVFTPGSISASDGVYNSTSKQFGIFSDGRILATDGSTSFPGFAWGNDTNTGLYRSAENQVAVVAGAVNCGTFASGTISTASPETATTSGYKYVLRNNTFGTLYNFTSIRSSKEQITYISDVGSIVDSLRPVTFVPAFKPVQDGDVETDDQKTLREADLQYGFIAEEIAEAADGKLAQWEWTSEGTLKPVGWKWQDVIALLTAEVKSLRARLSAIEAS